MSGTMAQVNAALAEVFEGFRIHSPSDGCALYIEPVLHDDVARAMPLRARPRPGAKRCRSWPHASAHRCSGWPAASRNAEHSHPFTDKREGLALRVIEAAA